MTNTPIDDLLDLYRSERCDFENIESVAQTALMYVEQMPDSHVRCLLYLLAKETERRVKEDRLRKRQNEQGV